MEIYPEAVGAARRNTKARLKEAKASISWLEGSYREEFDRIINKTHFKKQPDAIKEVNEHIATKVKDYERIIKKCEYDLRFLESFRTGVPLPKAKNGVTDEQIERAKQYPIKDLIKVVRKQARCLWHDDKKPSMHVYDDNHAYCYVCPRRADAIDIQMAVGNMTFIEAVKYLAP